MSLRVYNTLTQQKEPFQPFHPGKVGIYLCGPTVYRNSHIGHAVGPVIFDAIKRYLEYKGFRVTWVVNITDVEDKIILEAAKQGCGVYELAERVARNYCEGLRALGVSRIDHMPKASEHIDDIIRIIEKLVDRGYAYAVEGDVYFDVTKDDDYGKLSNRDTADQAGQRELVSRGKRHAQDFTLWKAAKPEEPAEVSFDSPWGRGRPGWHIECSAMGMRFLGETFDFHGGGMDLVFPHHENEIAQSESATGKPFARYWLHNGLTRLNTKKISKSDHEMQAALDKLTLSNLLQHHSGELLRFFILSTHYRRPIDFSDEEIASKQKGLETFYRLFERVERGARISPYEPGPTLAKPQLEEFDQAHHEFIQTVLEVRTQFLDAMDDDFNTAGAIAALFTLASQINRFMDQRQVDLNADEALRRVAGMAARTLVADARILGLFEKPVDTRRAAADGLSEKLLELLVGMRNQAKKEKNFALADRIRDGLAGIGVTLEDRPGGTIWRYF